MSHLIFLDFFTIFFEIEEQEDKKRLVILTEIVYWTIDFHAIPSGIRQTTFMG